MWVKHYKKQLKTAVLTEVKSLMVMKVKDEGDTQYFILDATEQLKFAELQKLMQDFLRSFNLEDADLKKQQVDKYGIFSEDDNYYDLELINIFSTTSKEIAEQHMRLIQKAIQKGHNFYDFTTDISFTEEEANESIEGR